jgi:homoserine acetyltransferase
MERKMNIGKLRAVGVLLALATPAAEMGGRNRLWRHMIVEAIRDDPEWKNAITSNSLTAIPELLR